MRHLLPVPLALLVLAGCGAGDLKSKGPDETPCPAGVAQLKVKDILPQPPTGFRIAAPDAFEAGPIKDGLRDRLGKRLRSVGARSVIKRGDGASTLLFVVNSAERWSSRDLLAGADQIAEQLEAEPQKLTIAGEDGVLVAGPTTVLASGGAGECASVMLVGSRETDVRAIAARIRRAQ